MSKTIYDMGSGDLAEQLTGKSIVSVSGDSMTLNDGTVLELEDTADCCAWFSGSLEVIDLSDNMITNVEHVNRDPEDGSGHDEYDEHYSLHILSAHKLIAKVNIDGNASSGYYCHSINLKVRAGK